MPSDDDWDVPTDVTTPPTWIAAAENARTEQATLAAIERAQLRDLAAPACQAVDGELDARRPDPRSGRGPARGL